MDKFSSMIFRLFLVIVIISTGTVSGCKRQQSASEIDNVGNTLANTPNVEKIVVTKDFIAKAIGVTGGYKAGTKTDKLQLDYVITFYKPQGGTYLTEHRYEVYP